MPELRRIGSSDLEVFPIALGANVFGWTADRAATFAVLDAYTRGGGNFLDTSDSYSFWAPGNAGGESETLIGEWLADRQARERVVIATKVSQHPKFHGIEPATIERGIEASLARLGVDQIDLYYAHFDQPEKPLEPTVRAFSDLVDSGRVRCIGVSNFSATRIRQWLTIADRRGYHRPVALQPPYNLMERNAENALIPMARREGLQIVAYWALARGFLTGKYRRGADDAISPRAEAAAAYLTDAGRRVLAALDTIAGRHGVQPTTIAIAWLLAQDRVIPIASARTPEQLSPILDSVRIRLSSDELDLLNSASAP